MLRLITPVFARFVEPQTEIQVEPQTEAWKGICIDTTTGIATLQGFECIFANILRIIIPLAGIAAFVILLLGGFQYITSGGDTKAIESAQKTLTSAIGGLILIVLAFLILVLISKITGVDVTTFKVFQGG